MRLNGHAKMRASTRTSSVLAVPGMPSIRTWPPANRHTSTCSTTSSWPMNTLAMFWRAAWYRSRRFVASEKFVTDVFQFVKGLEKHRLVPAAPTGGRLVAVLDRVVGEQLEERSGVDRPVRRCLGGEPTRRRLGREAERLLDVTSQCRACG